MAQGKGYAMTKMPPVPPDNQSPKGTGSEPKVTDDPKPKDRPQNLGEQGRQGNIKQNTTNQGNQQDRARRCGWKRHGTRAPAPPAIQIPRATVATMTGNSRKIHGTAARSCGIRGKAASDIYLSC